MTPVSFTFIFAALAELKSSSIDAYILDTTATLCTERMGHKNKAR